MEPSTEYKGKFRMLKERTSKLVDACLRINENLEFDNVLEGVVESVRQLTDARYGLIIVLDEAGSAQERLTAGMTPEETAQLWTFPEGERILEYFANIETPLRLRDFHSHTRALGLPEFDPPQPTSPTLSFMSAPLRHRNQSFGCFFVCEKKNGGAFTAEDEETLAIFASQAALVLANARRFRDERRARADLEALIETSPVGVVVIDSKTGKFASYNREAERITEGLGAFDRRLDELLDVIKIRRADGREVSLDELSLAKALETGETVRAEEVVIEAPDGRRVTALINATPIRSGDGVIESFVVTMQDMTHLHALDRLRAEFLAVASHELNAPLTAIKGSAKTGLDRTPTLRTPEIKQLFRVIDYQTEQMEGLINDLLDVARITTGTLTVDQEPTSLTELVDRARVTFLSGGGRNNLKIELPPDLPLVMADMRRIVQVLANLLTNASENSPEASDIRLTAVKKGVYVEVSVIDGGQGVSADRLPHLFRTFPRPDGGGLADHAGSGRGLAICKGIVEAHGGRINARNEGIGLGARFSFTIPIAEESGPAEPVSVPDRGKRSRKGKLSILVVDDDPETLRNVRHVLSNAGYTLFVTGDPREAPNLVAKRHPNLVLLDLVLQGTDGVEVMRRVREREDVPVVFISAYGHDEAIARALDAGADDYLVKPFSPTELTARIRAALRKRYLGSGASGTNRFELDHLTIEYDLRRVTVGMREAQLTDVEYRLLEELSLNVHRTLTYRHLLTRVWRKTENYDRRSLRTVIKNLRRKLGDDSDDPSLIFNETRVGYRLGGKP